LRLTLKQEHQQLVARYNGGILPQFSSAKFAFSWPKKSIVACIGTAIVSWDLKKIVEENKPKYKIFLVGGENVVDVQPFGGDEEVMFISPNQFSTIKF
jgi:hypothetical protein